VEYRGRLVVDLGQIFSTVLDPLFHGMRFVLNAVPV
jgi:hypothetical protein